TFQSGVADYILKPKLEPNELLKVLKKAASKFEGTDATSTPHHGEHVIDQYLERMVAGFDTDSDPETVGWFFPHDGFRIFVMPLKTTATLSMEVIETALHEYSPTAVCRSFSAKRGIQALLVNDAYDRLHRWSETQASV